MKRTISYFASSVICACVVMLLSAACGSTFRSTGSHANDGTVEEITRLERRFAEAALQGDSATIESMLAPEFVGVDPGGKELSRSQVLDGLKAPERVIEELRHENIRVRILGDCAVVFATTVMKGSYQGKAFAGEFPYMRVWVKRHGRWLAAATQSSSGTGEDSAVKASGANDAETSK